MHCQIVAVSAPMSTPAETRLNAPEVAAPEGLPVPAATPATPAAADPRPRELGGRDGPEPTRFGDWEKAGRCIDF